MNEYAAAWGALPLGSYASLHPQLASSIRCAAQWCTHKLKYLQYSAHPRPLWSGRTKTYTLITTLHMHRGCSMWDYRRRNNLSAPANCVYPGWQRRPLTGPPQSTSEPPLAPASVDPDIVDYFQPRGHAVFSLPDLYFSSKCQFCVRQWAQVTVHQSENQNWNVHIPIG